MPASKSKAKLIVVVLILLAVAVGALWHRSSLNRSLKLPVGRGTPAISLGERHGLILASDGSLWTWGCDFLGWPVLGLGTNVHQTIGLRRIGTETNWVAISAGESHSVALKSDGTLWTWGQSIPGLRLLPFPVPAAPGNDWKQAAAGGILTAAVKKDGTLWTWGNNWSGSLGTGSTNNSAVPVQVGSDTNWVRVWADILETVALRSDGSLWYWGDNPNPEIDQKFDAIRAPMRVSPDTNWVDVGFGVNTVFATKSDGSLWTWGRNADAYTGARDPALDVIPTRIGTNSDWQSFSSCPGWWITGLTKKDGSLWLMDLSDGKPNGPRPPYPPVQFRPVAIQKPCAAYAGGSAHAAAAGDHRPIEVIVTPDGEVWTSGVVLGDPLTPKGRWLNLASRLVQLFNPRISPPDAPAVLRDQPWQLWISEPDGSIK